MRGFILTSALVLTAGVLPTAAYSADESKTTYYGPVNQDFVLFDSYPLPGAYLYSKTESTGPSWVCNLSGKLPVRTEPAFTPGSSLELSYVSYAGGNWKATLQKHPIRGIDDWDNGVFIQTKPTPYKKPAFLQFRLHSQNTGRAEMPKVALLVKGEKEPKSSASVDIAPFAKGADESGWSLIKIPLSSFNAQISAAEQIQGLVFEQSVADEKTHNLFIDQIEVRPSDEQPLNKGIKPQLVEAKGFERHVDLKWTPPEDTSVQGAIIERSKDGTNFIAVAYRPKLLSRCADWVGDQFGDYHYRVRFLGYDGSKSAPSEVLHASTKMLNDDQLLDMVQEACSRYYWDGAEPNSGLTLESVPGDPNMIATGASGFGIMSLVVAADRKFITRPQMVERMNKILNYLEKQDHFHGAMAHYYDGRTGHPVLFFGPDDNGGDMVETSFLMQGLLTARQFLNSDWAEEKSIRERITKLWEAVEWNWYRKTPDSPYLLWHWSPTVGYKINHSLIGWNETMITYMLAIASPTHPIPAEMYYSGWASQEKGAQEYRGNEAGKMYTNGGIYYGQKLPVGGFTGGPMFFTHYNFLGVDPHALKDKYTEYFENCKAIATINLRYCQVNPGKHLGYGADAWGLTASDGPWGYNPDEPRTECDKGKITPTGALASMPYLPVDSMNALKNYYRNQGSFLWGEYGFRDAYSPEQNWVNDLYMGLNQGPIVVMIENYRTGRPWKLFGSNPEIEAMRKKTFQNQ
ncbi:MAG: hypothetical protein K2X77_09065 [Candidatus Obscuribacterales bacterium]|nr:hypothetical protein [Candidatus Obscuribacterales bacterium]